MIQRFLLFFALLRTDCVSVAQRHDGVAQAQFTISEIGAGNLGDSDEAAIAIYKLKDNYYQKSKSMSKLEQRTLVNLLLSMERNHAIAIDSSFAARYKNAVLDLADRNIDVSWTSEGKKIEEAMSRWQANISQILTCGGSLSDYQRYKNDYESIKASIAAVGKAHLSNAHRKECYLLLCKDINERNALLATSLRGLLGVKLVEQYILKNDSNSTIKKLPRRDLAYASLRAWYYVWRVNYVSRKNSN